MKKKQAKKLKKFTITKRFNKIYYRRSYSQLLKIFCKK